MENIYRNDNSGVYPIANAPHIPVGQEIKIDIPGEDFSAIIIVENIDIPGETREEKLQRLRAKHTEIKGHWALLNSQDPSYAQIVLYADRLMNEIIRIEAQIIVESEPQVPLPVEPRQFPERRVDIFEQQPRVPPLIPMQPPAQPLPVLQPQPHIELNSNVSDGKYLAHHCAFICIISCIAVFTVPFIVFDSYILSYKKRCTGPYSEDFIRWFIIDLVMLPLMAIISLKMLKQNWDQVFKVNSNNVIVEKKIICSELFYMFIAFIVNTGMTVYGSVILFHPETNCDKTVVNDYMWFRMIIGYLTVINNINSIRKNIILYNSASE